MKRLPSGRDQSQRSPSRSVLILLALLILGIGVATVRRAGASEEEREAEVAACGIERWNIKIGTDAGASAIDLTQPLRSTVLNMRLWLPPQNLPIESRVAPFETTLVVVDAILVKYKLEDDSDLHLVIMDPLGNTMIAEIPSPACVNTGPFARLIAGARGEFEASFLATASYKTTNTPIRLTGIPFFDYIHGQTGVAPNGIEIHPVLSVEVNPPPRLQSVGLPSTGYLVRPRFGLPPTPTPTRTPVQTSTPTPTFTPTLLPTPTTGPPPTPTPTPFFTLAPTSPPPGNCTNGPYTWDAGVQRCRDRQGKFALSSCCGH